MERFSDTCATLGHSFNTTTSGHHESNLKNAFEFTSVDVLSSDFSFSHVGEYNSYTQLTSGAYKSYSSTCQSEKREVDRNQWIDEELLSHGDTVTKESLWKSEPQLRQSQRDEPITCDSHWTSEPKLCKGQTDEPVTDECHRGSDPELCKNLENGPITKESRFWGDFVHEDHGEKESQPSQDDKFVPEMCSHFTKSVVANKTSMMRNVKIIFEDLLFQNQKEVFQNQEAVPQNEASAITAETLDTLTAAPASMKTRVSEEAAFVDEVLPSRDKERSAFQNETPTLQSEGLFSKRKTHLPHNISGPYPPAPYTGYVAPESPCYYHELGAVPVTLFESATAIHPLLAHYTPQDTAEECCDLSNPASFISPQRSGSVFSDMELSSMDPDNVISQSQHVSESHNVLSVSQNVSSNEARNVPSEAEQQHFAEYHTKGSYAFRNRTSTQNLQEDDSDQSQWYTSDSCESACTMTSTSEDASVGTPSSTRETPCKKSAASSSSLRKHARPSAATYHKSAGTSFKERKTSDVRSDQDPASSALPPCRVCGGKASGFHYGVNSCDACKGFFRRALKRRRIYVCSGNRSCPIRGQRRISCAYCRYQRCLAVGMSRQAIKIGRYTSAMRAHNSNELRMQKTKVDSLDLQDEEVDAILRDLMHAGKASLFSADDYTPEEILMKQEACVQEYLSQTEILGSLENLPPEVREEVLKETGIDADPCKEHLERHAVNVEKYVRRYIRFGKGVPGFKELSLDDQANLLKTARMEIWFLAAYPGYNNNLQVTHFPNGRCEHYGNLSKVFGMAHLYAVGDLAKRLKRYRFTPEEMVVVKAICLMSTDRCPLEQPEKVEEVQWLLTRCLLRLFERRSPSKSRQLLTEAVETLVACRDMKALSDHAVRQDPLKQVYSKHRLLEEVILMCP